MRQTKIHRAVRSKKKKEEYYHQFHYKKVESAPETFEYIDGLYGAKQTADTTTPKQPVTSTNRIATSTLANKKIKNKKKKNTDVGHINNIFFQKK